jgi:pimeloyl-ACP methyl ester carboxylesterase
LSRQATRIRAVLDTLGIGRTLIVAQGTSATAALHLAAEDRDRVIGVLSLAGGLVSQQGTRGMRLVLAMSWLLDNPLGRAIGRRQFESTMRAESADDAWITREVMKQYLQPFEGDLRGTLGALRAMQSAVEPVLIADRLRAIQAPVYLLMGDKPSGAAPTDAQILMLRERLPSFRLDTIVRSGIMLHEEQPDAVVSAVLSMLRPPHT